MNVSKILLLCLSIALFMSACTKKQIYNAVQENRKQQCYKSPTAHHYDQCIRNHSESYEAYQQRRVGKEDEKDNKDDNN